MSIPAIPVQIARCACTDENDWRPCQGEFFSCDSCGDRSDDPFPYAEPYNSDRPEGAWWYYCRPCAFEWILDGCDVRAVRAA